MSRVAVPRAGSRWRARTQLVALLVALTALAGSAAHADGAPLDAVAGARLSIDGSAASGTIGSAIAAVPDMTGDGRSALVVGAPYTGVQDRPQSGVVYVLFDTSLTGTVSIDDPALRGFRIIGGPYHRAGSAVASAGDVNGDGRGDILVSAPRHGVACATPMSGPCGYKTPGTAFVVYGKSGTGTVDLAHLRASQGFAIKGVSGAPFAPSPITLAGLGDFAGGSFGAIAVTGVSYQRGGFHYRAGAYVIYGGRHGGTVDLQNLGTRGLRIARPGRAGRTESLFVAPAGDVNGDHRPDLLLQAYGDAYVIFGAAQRRTIALDRLGSSGVRITGLGKSSQLPMAGVGDVNGDRRGDLLLARGVISPNGLPPAEADVVYGSRSTRTVDLAHLGSRGFRVLPGPVPTGETLQLGPLAGLGDLNGDGRADLAVAYETYPPGGAGPFNGVLSVVFGSGYTHALQLDSLDTAGSQLTAPTPPSSCPPLTSSGNRLATAVTAVGDFGANRGPEFAVSATGLGPLGTMPCSLALGEILVEPAPGR